MPGAYPLQSLIRQLNGVQTVGQADAATRAALAAAAAARVVAGNELPTGIAGAFAGSASASKTIAVLDQAVERVRANAPSVIMGSARTGVGASWQKGLRPRISGVYEILFDIYDRANRPPAYLDGLVAELGRSIERYSDTMQGQGLLVRAGTIIGDVGGQAVKGVGKVGKGVGEGVTAGLGDVLGAIWKPLAVAGVLAIVVGGIYLVTLSKVRA